MGFARICDVEQELQLPQVLQLRIPLPKGLLQTREDRESSHCARPLESQDSSAPGDLNAQNQLGPQRVRIPVCRNQQAIRLSVPGHHVDRARCRVAQAKRRTRKSSSLVILAGSHDRQICPGELPPCVAPATSRASGPAAGLVSVPDLDERFGEAGLAVDVVEIQAVRIRHPARVHLVVLARGDAVDLVPGSRR